MLHTTPTQPSHQTHRSNSCRWPLDESSFAEPNFMEPNLVETTLWNPTFWNPSFWNPPLVEARCFRRQILRFTWNALLIVGNAVFVGFVAYTCTHAHAHAFTHAPTIHITMSGYDYTLTLSMDISMYNVIEYLHDAAIVTIKGPSSCSKSVGQLSFLLREVICYFCSSSLQGNTGNCWSRCVCVCSWSS